MAGRRSESNWDDSYLRLFAGRPASVSEPPTRDRALTFVDIDSGLTDVDELIAAFQQIPHRLGATAYLLLRWPTVTATDPDSPEDAGHDKVVQTWLQRLHEDAAALGIGQRYTGIVRFRVGGDPVVTWADAQAPTGLVTDRELLSRAAAVEIATLLEWGGAIGRPDTYHYELPSGRHAAAFVRVANAIRSPRDALALSSWLAAALRDGSGLLLDSGTLTPLVVQLQAFQTARGWGTGPVEVLDSYPRTRIDAARAARTMRRSPTSVLGLLSVSSSGAVRDLMAEALRDALPSGVDWSMTVMVDRTHPSDRELSVGVLSDVSTLLGIDDSRLDGLNAANCQLCRSHTVAPLVRIDPRSFDPHVLPDPELLMPSTKDGRANARLWDACDTTGSIGVAATPHSSASRSRPKGQLLGVRVHFEDLLGHEAFLLALDDRLGDLLSQDQASLRGDSFELKELRTCDVVVVTPEDRAMPGFDLTWTALRRKLKIPASAQVVELSPGAPATELSAYERALILTLGTVTGWTMRQQLTAIQDAWSGHHDRDIFGLILHARPSTEREWQNLFNSYGRHLRAVWRTFLPWRSPLAEEHLVLEELRATRIKLSAEGRAFLDERRRYCQPRVGDWRQRVREPGAENVRSLLWGMAPRGGPTEVRNQSIYGFQISPMTAFAAIGAAMHTRRTERQQNAARWRVFEMPAVTRSYYDAILVACVLRWLEPAEAWWGRGNQPEQTITELVGRTTDPSELRLLLPELLLAASQGKTPHGAAQVIVDLARGQSTRWSRLDHAPIEVGLALVELSLGVKPS